MEGGEGCSEHRRTGDGSHGTGLSYSVSGSTCVASAPQPHLLGHFLLHGPNIL